MSSALGVSLHMEKCHCITPLASLYSFISPGEVKGLNQLFSLFLAACRQKTYILCSFPLRRKFHRNGFSHTYTEVYPCIDHTWTGKTANSRIHIRMLAHGYKLNSLISFDWYLASYQLYCFLLFRIWFRIWLEDCYLPITLKEPNNMRP